VHEKDGCKAIVLERLLWKTDFHDKLRRVIHRHSLNHVAAG